MKIETADLARVAFCLFDQLDSSGVTIDPAMPSKPGKILDELSSSGYLDGFSKRYIFVGQDSIEI